jgi:hypothetical protein
MRLVHLSACVPGGKEHHTFWKLQSSWYEPGLIFHRTESDRPDDFYTAISNSWITSTVLLAPAG